MADQRVVWEMVEALEHVRRKVRAARHDNRDARRRRRTGEAIDEQRTLTVSQNTYLARTV